MSEPDAPDPRSAGVTLVAGAVLVGLPVPFALTGLFAGLAVGFARVHSRFKDI